MRTVQRTSILRSVASGPPPGQRERDSRAAAALVIVRGALLVFGAGLFLLCLLLLFRAGRREAERVAALEAARAGAAARTGALAGQLAAARVTISVYSNPPGALVRYPDGNAVTPAQLQVPRSREPLTLLLSRSGFQDEALVVTPDVSRDHFVALQALSPPAASRRPEPPGEEAEDGEAEDGGGPRILLERFVDTYLDARLRGCCQEAGPCGHVLLEGAVSAAGRVGKLAVHLNPPQPQASRCINGVLRAARRVRVQRGEAPQSFMRSYSFDAPGGSTVAGLPPARPVAAAPDAGPAVVDREGRSPAVVDREGRSPAVVDREGRSPAVVDREAAPASQSHDLSGGRP